MIKGMVITPVVVGRISIGETVEKGDRVLPKKSDEFHITSNVQNQRKWIEHPAGAEARALAGNGKLRTIPIRIMFDSPDNNFKSGYAAFNDKGRQLCGGNGEKAIRVDPVKGKTEEVCPGPDFCVFGKAKRCKPYARLIVALESEFHKDPLSGFAFRTTSYNSVSALTARLHQYAALTGGKMAGFPANLVLRSKSTAASMRQAIFYADITPREDLRKSVEEAAAYRKSSLDAGMDLGALDKMVTSCFDGSVFIEAPDDTQMPLEEAPINVDGQGNELPSDSQGEQFGTDFQEGQTGTNASSPDQEPLHPSYGPSPVSNNAPVQQSKVLSDMLKRINSVANLNAISACEIWIKNNRDLKDKAEINIALTALSKRSRELAEPVTN